MTGVRNHKVVMSSGTAQSTVLIEIRGSDAANKVLMNEGGILVDHNSVLYTVFNECYVNTTQSIGIINCDFIE